MSKLQSASQLTKDFSVEEYIDRKRSNWLSSNQPSSRECRTWRIGLNLAFPLFWLLISAFVSIMTADAGYMLLMLIYAMLSPIHVLTVSEPVDLYHSLVYKTLDFWREFKASRMKISLQVFDVQVVERKQSGQISVCLSLGSKSHQVPGSSKTFSESDEEAAIGYTVELRELADEANEIIRIKSQGKSISDEEIQKEISFDGFADRVKSRAKA